MNANEQYNKQPEIAVPNHPLIGRLVKLGFYVGTVTRVFYRSSPGLLTFCVVWFDGESTFHGQNIIKENLLQM